MDLPIWPQLPAEKHPPGVELHPTLPCPVVLPAAAVLAWPGLHQGRIIVGFQPISISDEVSVSPASASMKVHLPQLPGFPLSLNVFLGLGSHLLTSDSGFKFLTNLQTLFYFYINASCSSQSWYKNKINK